MHTKKVEHGITHAKSTVLLIEAAKEVLRKYVRTCPDGGLKVVGIDFELYVTPINSVLGQQEWFIEIVNTAKPQENTLLCVYRLRYRSLHFLTRGKR